MFPGYVSDLDDAWVAFEGWLEGLGGELPDEIVVSPIVDSDGGTVGVEFRELLVEFPASETFLQVALTIDIALLPTDYKFDFRHRDGTLIWRYDMHRGHESQHGGPWHVHDGTEENRRPSEPMDLHGIAELVVAFNARNARR